MKQRMSKQQVSALYTLEHQIRLSRTEVRGWPRWILEASGVLEELGPQEEGAVARSPKTRRG
jgi:hypothetical protein